ncbi:type II toxin-antitoxin system death-on-curing family toxin [Sphingobium phenoxybenzoativorans]|uniref:Type II toxin-antitoxin system death-on-curing family toxin n=1 Tax=Sphingobium phenoxybenzoativorans TaxID=1592790 RepID=A0A975Q0P6_9SPHN|nr:type II toxin-antitoxin system death-on-curing family toxin [Sphingobium phenoxybenzoativorans]QUT04542.1 type II toxin-antitoxin system death-on-curing family toxin [Sphingobium phenoxybenzoativorans]
MTETERREPRWIAQDIILAVHDRQLAEHGGGSGIRDQGLLESALARPLNRWSYGEDDLATLAACYAFGIARNHPFVDGNKRTAWVAARLFLVINDATLIFEKADAIATMLALASGDLPEDELALWFRERLA